jgi:hypothetical protein
MTRRPARLVSTLTRGLAAAFAIASSVFLAAPAAADVGPADVEEAADVARRAALDLIRSRDGRLFSEALDADGILLRRLGADAWNRLTDRQRERLRGAVRERFRRTLAPPPVAAGDVPAAEIAWSAAQPAGNGVDAFFGLKFDSRMLKTRWSMRHVGGGWRIADIVLTDPAVSIARTAEQSLGPRPSQRGTPSQEIWSNLAPRAGAVVVILLVAVILLLRLPAAKRPLVYWTAFAPIALIAIDGWLAVQRVLSEPYVLAPESGSDRWRTLEQAALSAEREGNVDAAREIWGRALAAGGPAGPIEYQIGLAALRRGDTVRAQAEFSRSLSERDAAPGAARELAAIQVAAGRYAEAEPYLTRYLDLTGPDPDTLSLLAVVQTNTGKNAQALETIRRARALVSGEAWRGEELEAQVHARAGDAAGTVAALRPLDAQGLVDRTALRSDPTYLPIANDPAWIAFLNERKRSP